MTSKNKLPQDLVNILENFNEGVVVSKRDAENKLSVHLGRKTSVYEGDPKMAKRSGFLQNTKIGNALSSIFTLSSSIVRLILFAVIAIVFVISVIFSAAFTMQIAPPVFDIPIIICSAILVVIAVWKA